jgi:ABC-type nitrate/sulfonate/bicarbonate transport system permease component
MNPFVMSKPSLIFVGLWREMETGQLWSDLVISAQPFLFGFISAVVIGIFIGTMMGWRARVGYALDPFMTAFYASPLVAIAPLVIIFFGVGVSGKAILIFVLCVFPFIFNTYAGVQAVDRLLINVVRSLGGSEREIYIKVIVPSVLPYIVAGARYAALGVPDGQIDEEAVGGLTEVDDELIEVYLWRVVDRMLQDRGISGDDRIRFERLAGADDVQLALGGKRPYLRR